ncbi:PREDICTED: metallophosphoesterase MPPED2-like [Buceros rhinoceros silvestris]|uniref:metallophosphoesterase MPPED2-like n=1 Tax=Buceros rhinoceros silvestris TaxID=175836 RepID=UPI000528592C|nr:PREDICTED: metallophosphoesterase MPPED2-like [Buceros rhinoceros silvestris]
MDPVTAELPLRCVLNEKNLRRHVYRELSGSCRMDPVTAELPLRTPWFNGWGFNLPRGQSLLDKWNLIPEGIDILMTHGPPLGFRDWVPKELQRVGCVELLNTVQRRVRPKLHVFGGIHEGYGIMTDGYTTYINASTCTVSFQPTNPPIIFDLPTPQGS